MGVEEDRAERLRRLQERRGAAAPRSAPPAPQPRAADADPVGAVASVEAAAVDRPARSGRRRRHAAPAGRVLAAGISASAFLGGMAAIGANPPSWASGATTTGNGALPVPVPPPSTLPPTTAAPVPSTVVVVEEVHHQLYVDQYGNPIDGSAVPASARSSATRTVASSSAGAGPGGSSGAAPAPVTAPASPAPAAPAPVVTSPPPPPPPACSGSTC